VLCYCSSCPVQFTVGFEWLHRTFAGPVIDVSNRLGPVLTLVESAPLPASVRLRYGRLTEVPRCFHRDVQLMRRCRRATRRALTSRATHAHPTSPRSIGFCAIWDCISSSWRTWTYRTRRSSRHSRRSLPCPARAAAAAAAPATTPAAPVMVAMDAEHTPQQTHPGFFFQFSSRNQFKIPAPIVQHSRAQLIECN